MPGKDIAAKSGKEFEERVNAKLQSLGLETKTQVKVGKRLWGKKRYIDIVARNPNDGRRLGIECKYQAKAGSAEEKLIAMIADIEAWPLDGILVYGGGGFSTSLVGYLDSTGKAIQIEDLDDWLKLFFDLG